MFVLGKASLKMGIHWWGRPEYGNVGDEEFAALHNASTGIYTPSPLYKIPIYLSTGTGTHLFPHIDKQASLWFFLELEFFWMFDETFDTIIHAP